MFKKLCHFCRKHSTKILTIASLAGVIFTTANAIHDTTRTMKEIQTSKEYDTAETVKIVLRNYIPTATFLALTAVCILKNSSINKKQQATIMAAYSLLHKQCNEYKKQIKERYGEETLNEINEDVKKATCQESAETDIRLYYDSYSERYFELRPSAVRNADYELNRLFAVLDEVTLNDYYKLLGVSTIPDGDDKGWSKLSYNWSFFQYNWIEIDYHNTIMEDGLECIIISMPIQPDENFRRY